jgi:hypothetical protein
MMEVEMMMMMMAAVRIMSLPVDAPHDWARLRGGRTP